MKRRQLYAATAQLFHSVDVQLDGAAYAS